MDLKLCELRCVLSKLTCFWASTFVSKSHSGGTGYSAIFHLSGIGCWAHWSGVNQNLVQLLILESLFRCEPKHSALLLKWANILPFFMLFCSIAVQDKLDQMVFIWENIHTLVEEREAKLLDVMELAEKFWCDHMSLVVTTKDTQDFIRDLEDPGIDPSVVKQQQEAAEVSRISHLQLRNTL